MNATYRPAVTALTLCTALLGPVALAAEPPAASDHAAEIAAFRAERDASLRKEESWLTLVGLAWLREGENTVGSNPGSDVLLPAGKAPGRLGVMTRTGETVRLVLTEGTGVAIDGEPAPAGEISLAADVTGKATKVTVSTLSFYLIQRGDKIGVRIKDRESAVRVGFTGIESYPLDAAWRIRARFEPYDPPRPIKIPNVLGQSTEDTCPGAVVFERDGKTYRLEPTGEAGEELFVVFGDATNGKETYGGGRFLDLPAPGADGTIVIDFNRAYNPPCVFTPYATCPLPPRGNKLTLAIPAGEKMYGDGGHHP